MTRNEAIRKAIDIVVYLKAHFAKSKEAIKDAEEIIEALEQIKEEQPVNKLTQQAYEDGKKDGYFQAKADQILKAGWIPVSERLPNLDDFTGSKVWQKKVLITGYLSFDDTKDLFVSEAFAKDVICNSVHDTVVTAWMPLPYGYLPETEEEGEKRI